MKNLFSLFILFLFLNQIYAQEILKNDSIAVSAIYPGCESFESDIQKSWRCLSQKLTAQLNDELASFAEIMERKKLNRLLQD